MNLRKEQLAKLRDTQYKMIRKMVKFKKAPEETIDVFMERTNSFIKHLIIDNDSEPWDYSYHREVYKWAGTSMKIHTCDKSRLSACVYNHKDWAWIQFIASQNGGRQLHGRYFKAWRWERPLYNYLGIGWKSRAADFNEWMEGAMDFVQWRALNR